MPKRILYGTVIVSFLLTSLGPYPQARADAVSGLPAPGTMVNLSPAYEPVIIKGLTVHKDNPFLFDFIVDVGQDKMSGEPLKKEGEKLIKYFLAGLAIPDKDVWVNLSPYEKNRMIPQALGQTDMGRDLLEQDYILKQITASLIYPEKDLGKKFWDKVYARSQAMYGTTQIPVNTFNKVWIMADRAEVFEHNQTAFVVDSHLKVMLEEDYLALQRHVSLRGGVADEAISKRTTNNPHSIASQIIKQIILPELEREVNTGKNFANLRQIFNSIILASWYKRNLKEALLNQVYADQSKVKGIDLNDPTVQERIYEQYLKAYKKGVFNYIKEDISSVGETIPRKYFSGGIDEAMAANPGVTTDAASLANLKLNNLVDFATLASSMQNPADEAMNAVNTLTNAQVGEELDMLFFMIDLVQAGLPLYPKYSNGERGIQLFSKNSQEGPAFMRSFNNSKLPALLRNNGFWIEQRFGSFFLMNRTNKVQVLAKLGVLYDLLRKQLWPEERKSWRNIINLYLEKIFTDSQLMEHAQKLGLNVLPVKSGQELDFSVQDAQSFYYRNQEISRENAKELISDNKELIPDKNVYSIENANGFVLIFTDKTKEGADTAMNAEERNAEDFMNGRLKDEIVTPARVNALIDRLIGKQSRLSPNYQDIIKGFYRNKNDSGYRFKSSEFGFISTASQQLKVMNRGDFIRMMGTLLKEKHSYLARLLLGHLDTTLPREEIGRAADARIDKNRDELLMLFRPKLQDMEYGAYNLESVQPRIIGLYGSQPNADQGQRFILTFNPQRNGVSSIQFILTPENFKAFIADLFEINPRDGREFLVALFKISEKDQAKAARARILRLSGSETVQTNLETFAQRLSSQPHGQRIPPELGNRINASLGIFQNIESMDDYGSLFFPDVSGNNSQFQGSPNAYLIMFADLMQKDRETFDRLYEFLNQSDAAMIAAKPATKLALIKQLLITSVENFIETVNKKQRLPIFYHYNLDKIPDGNLFAPLLVSEYVLPLYQFGYSLVDAGGTFYLEADKIDKKFVVNYLYTQSIFISGLNRQEDSLVASYGSAGMVELPVLNGNYSVSIEMDSGETGQFSLQMYRDLNHNHSPGSARVFLDGADLPMDGHIKITIPLAHAAEGAAIDVTVGRMKGDLVYIMPETDHVRSGTVRITRQGDFNRSITEKEDDHYLGNDWGFVMQSYATGRLKEKDDTGLNLIRADYSSVPQYVIEVAQFIYRGTKILTDQERKYVKPGGKGYVLDGGGNRVALFLDAAMHAKDPLTNNEKVELVDDMIGAIEPEHILAPMQRAPSRVQIFLMDREDKKYDKRNFIKYLFHDKLVALRNAGYWLGEDGEGLYLTRKGGIDIDKVWEQLNELRDFLKKQVENFEGREISGAEIKPLNAGDKSFNREVKNLGLESALYGSVSEELIKGAGAVFYNNENIETKEAIAKSSNKKGYVLYGAEGYFLILAPTDKAMTTEKPTIVVAEDNVVVRFTIKTVLENKGFNVLTAENQIELENIIKDHGKEGSLLITDSDGWIGTVARLRKEYHMDIPIIATSATLGEEDWRKEGVVPFAFIEKSQITSRLLAEVQKIFPDAAMKTITTPPFELQEIYSHLDFNGQDWTEENLLMEYRKIENWILHSPYGHYLLAAREYEANAYGFEKEGLKINGIVYSRLWTIRHEMGVTVRAYNLARSLGLPDDKVLDISFAAAIHDIGKTETPYTVLNLAKGFTPEQQRIMQEHVIEGDKILARLGVPSEIRQMIIQHHEHLDGTGYPNHPREEEFTPAARILVVADVYSSLRESRPYHSIAYSVQGAIEFIQKQNESGRIYDTQDVQALKGMEPELTSVDFARHMVASLPDRATLASAPGGIDLNTSNGMQWKISKEGNGVEMNIDPAMIERIRLEGIDSLSPVILRMTPVTSIWSLVGLPKK